MPPDTPGHGDGEASRLGVLAGGGVLPSLVARAALARGEKPFIIAFKNFADADTVKGLEHEWLRLGAIGRVLAALKEAGVTHLCLAGRIGRPSWRDLVPDARGAQFLSRIGFDKLGDHALMAVVAEGLEGEGFAIVGPHEVAPELLAPPGVMGRQRPDTGMMDDLKRAREVATAIGRLDAGQGAVVQQGVVLAVEAAEGTDAMLSRCKDLARKGRGGVLVKVKKPQQDPRLDLPTIGTATVEAAAAAGLAGIGVEAGASLVIDRAAVVALADRRGLVLTGLDD
jgi:DUF1009 family protein